MNKEKITDEVLELVDSIIGANALIAIGMKLQGDICEYRAKIKVLLHKLRDVSDE